MDDAPLLRRFGQVTTDRFRDAGVSVCDDELDAGEPALDELREELAPRVLRLLGADRHREELAVAIEADAVGHQRRDVLHRPRPSRVEEGGVEEEVRDRAVDGRLPQLLDLGAKGLRRAAHRRLAHVLAHERLGDLADVAGRGAVDVGADHRVVDLRRPPLVAPDDGAAGSAALASARDLEVDRAHRGDEPAQVRAVPAVDPLGLPLPLPGPDHLADLVLQHDFQGDADRALEEGPQIGSEVLLRGQLKLGNLVHGNAPRPRRQARPFTLGFEELPFSFHPPRISESHNSRDTNRCSGPQSGASRRAPRCPFPSLERGHGGLQGGVE
jgi:hypothetical protein